MINFIYPRKITISRPTQTNQVGSIGYQGVLPSNEVILFTDIPASIQKKAGLRAPIAKLPSDVTQNYSWNIFVFNRFLPKDSIKNNDIVTDESGNRYQIYANYWNSLGYNMTSERLQN